MTSTEENVLCCVSACLNAAPAQSSASLLQDKHLEVLKLLMTPAESHCSQSQPHFLDALCQSGSWAEHTGGPVRVLETERELGKERKKTEKRENFGIAE